MNKKDVLILVGLFALLFLWGPIDRNILQPLFPKAPKPAAKEQVEESVRTDAAPDLAPETVAAPDSVRPDDNAVTPPEPLTEPQPVALPNVEEETAVLSNSNLVLRVSSLGGSIAGVQVKTYRMRIDPDSGPVELDFSGHHALAYRKLPGLTDKYPFSMETVSDRKVVFQRETESGLRLHRTLELADNYTLRIIDLLSNQGDQALDLDGIEMVLGPMHPLEGETMMYGMSSLGADTLSPGGEKVKHWGKKLMKWMKSARNGKIDVPVNKPVDWVAVKNKYFAQTLTPKEGGIDARIRARVNPEEKKVEEVSASIRFESVTLAPGDSLARGLLYYAGPKKLDELKKLGLHQNRVMELGLLAPIGELLLKMLNFIQAHVPPFNYGVAIMLLTLIIKTLFWPITHKGTESMRRMQELSPMMKEINEKYKDDAQKRQQKLMAFYKENKINPLGGCLPMVVQIPVFIGLFYVLRSAIELRYAGFLWISDLSEPERIFEFGFKVPLLGWDALNILPILMSISMYAQQKVMPSSASGGDPKQQEMQKMMMRIMPFMMLFFLYNFASGLALYWTTQNVLMIVQQLVYRKRKERKEHQAAVEA